LREIGKRICKAASGDEEAGRWLMERIKARLQRYFGVG
jgi:hypothetical protein